MSLTLLLYLCFCRGGAGEGGERVDLQKERGVAECGYPFHLSSTVSVPQYFGA